MTRGEPRHSSRARTMLAGITLITLCYCALWFGHYNQSALGESPALDNRQTLELARAMFDGRLADEPFHRAPLYPYLLSLFLNFGLPYELLPLIARWLNAISLAITAGLTSLLALRLWGSTACGWLAGLLVALNPVLLFFAGDAFDILMATAPLIAALWLLQIWFKQPAPKQSFIIGTLLALGAALRSHILPLALVWPIAAFCLTSQCRLMQAFMAALPVLVSFLLLGLANQQVSGEFRLMPWQGAYNLWAGNSPEASGRIYAQKIRVQFDDGYDNPAKLESIALYEKETGEEPPHSIEAMNTYWRQKTINHIAEHPADWLGLMFRKAYYFLNSYEQYDNKTYGFHKRLHPLLNWNPIHWGALLLLAVSGALVGLTNQKTRPFIVALIVIFALYAAGTILFYTSNRFRVPVVPVLAILSPGILLLPKAWKRTGWAWRTLLCICLPVTLVITYSGFFDARITDTWEEDYALLANASLRTARDEAAIRNARAALDMNPDRADMHAVLAQARFNQWALRESPSKLTASTVRELLDYTRKGLPSEPHLEAVEGLYLWKLKRHEEAVALWNRIGEEDALARLFLIWTDHSELPDKAALQALSEHPAYGMLKAAVALKSGQPAAFSGKFLDSLLSPVVPQGK